jgi:hypothetical protein
MRAPRARSEKVAVPAHDEKGSKRRLRSIKRKARPDKEGPPTAGVAGQRDAMRGNRLRQRHT